MFITERALDRRLKRHVLKETHSFFVPCAPSFETELEKELLMLVPEVKLERGGATVQAELDFMYHANLQLRTAHRVLLRIDDFLAQSYPMLFNAASKLAWEHYFGFTKAYKVTVSAKTSRLRHAKNISKTLSDAISARLEPLGLAAEVSEDASLEFFVRFFQDRCTISVNTSGEHLHKRGYKVWVEDAPLRETLAASVLSKLKVTDFEGIVDPMCGSGTLLLEAALLATNRPAGEFRDFAFEQLPFFQESKWLRFKREALDKTQETKLNFVGFDKNAKTIHSAKQNAVTVKLESLISFAVNDARSFKLEPQNWLIVSNLPYGARLESESSLAALLSDFAKHLESFKGCTFAFITKDSAWLEHFELREKHVFSNGGLKVMLVLGVVN